jgi:membrane protein YqaA with SNARE-associated domain
MFDPGHLAAWGLPGLFLIALLGGSVVPLPTEAVISALVVGGVRWGLVLMVATVGNVIGSTSLYVLGRWVAQGGAGPVGRWLQRRTANAGPRFDRAKRRLAKWGAPALSLSFIPIAGDVVILASGFVGVRPGPFLAFVALGRGLRYGTVAMSTLAAVTAVRG